MSLRRGILISCLLLALACLAGGCLLAGQWILAGLTLLPIAALGWHRKVRATWAPGLSLAGLVALAAAGLLLGAPAALIIPGAAAGLAAWDLVNLERTMAGSQASAGNRQFERRHVLYLAVALGLGVLLAASGKLVSLRIPFLPLLLLIIFDLFALDRASRYLQRGSSEHS